MWRTCQFTWQSMHNCTKAEPNLEPFTACHSPSLSFLSFLFPQLYYNKGKNNPKIIVKNRCVTDMSQDLQLHAVKHCFPMESTKMLNLAAVVLHLLDFAPSNRSFVSNGSCQDFHSGYQSQPAKQKRYDPTRCPNTLPGGARHHHHHHHHRAETG